MTKKGACLFKEEEEELARREEGSNAAQRVVIGSCKMVEDSCFGIKAISFKDRFLFKFVLSSEIFCTPESINRNI